MASFIMIDGVKTFVSKTRIPGIDNLQDLTEKPVEAKPNDEKAKPSKSKSSNKGN